MIQQIFFFFQEPTAILSRRIKACQRLVRQKRDFLQDRLPVKFQDVKYPKFKHEIFVRIDMKHSYFSNILLLAINFF